MIRRILTAGFAAAALIAAVPAGAQFMAADLLYIPGAAAQAGEKDTNWRSDIYITNVDGRRGHRYRDGVFADGADLECRLASAIGRPGSAGVKSDGFGYIDPLLEDIPPQRDGCDQRPHRYLLGG